jgi:hypothetical protein
MICGFIAFAIIAVAVGSLRNYYLSPPFTPPKKEYSCMRSHGPLPQVSGLGVKGRCYAQQVQVLMSVNGWP